ncbi:N-acetyltransferase [Rhodopirellula sp.]|jgi:GNAT superfamily N-acetyltransferase|nr:N-acetyltransferase [Rhodopirellula sp.]MDA9778559.1 N-acetyltransferase [Rubripirellula sp.]
MSESIQSRVVETRRDQKAFLQLERDLYRDDPHWVPPIWQVRKELCGFKPHPFYQDAQCKAFIVELDGRVVGRVVAIINHGHNRLYKEKRGFFGFYECENHLNASNTLLSAAGQWLADQGMTDVRGPVHPSLNYEAGLLVDGFDSPPTFMIPHNLPYYEQLLTNFGFEKTQDLYSYRASVDLLDSLDPKLQFVIDEATKRFGVTCRPISKANFKKDVRVFLEIYNQSLQQTWGYVPMSVAEIDHQAKGLQFLIVPNLTSIAEIDGRPVGAGFGLLDFNPIIKKINGSLFPFGWFHLLTGKKKLDCVRIISTNVLPEYQKWGLGLVTLSRLTPEVLKHGIKVGEFSWVLESNSLSRGTIERGGVGRSKVHRLYDRTLSDL